MRTTFERPEVYTYPESAIDSVRRWTSETGFFPAWYSGLGEAPAAPAERPWWQRAVEVAVPAAAAIYQQRQLARLNIERTRAGLPPITAEEFRRVYQPPAARVEVAPDPGVGRLLTWVAVGAGALVLMTLLRRR
jgi:hypothetical protein